MLFTRETMAFKPRRRRRVWSNFICRRRFTFASRNRVRFRNFYKKKTEPHACRLMLEQSPPVTETAKNVPLQAVQSFQPISDKVPEGTVLTLLTLQAVRARGS